MGIIIVRFLILVGLALFPARLWSQEVYVFGGVSQDREHARETSGAWALSYMEELGKGFAGSFTWFNEGHLRGQRRDGSAFQVWYRHYVLDKSLSLGAGAGPYVFYNTATRPDDTHNSHGVGTALSLAATWHMSSRWLLQLRGNMNTGESLDTLSVMLGVGYRADLPSSSTPRDSTPFTTAPNEICLLAGESIDNSYSHNPKNAVAFEYRRLISRFFEWTAGWLNEADASSFGRYGPYTQLFVGRRLFDERLALGLGLGPYLAHDVRAHEGTTTVAPMVTLTGAYQFAPSWDVRVSWNRVTTHYDSDADVIVGGLGHRF